LDHMRHVEFGHARGYTAPDIVVAPIRQSRPNALVEGDLANRPAGERPIVWTTKYEVTAASLRPTVKDVAHRRSDRNNVLAFVLGPLGRQHNPIASDLAPPQSRDLVSALCAQQQQPHDGGIISAISSDSPNSAELSIV